MSQEIERKFIVNKQFPTEPSWSYENSIYYDSYTIVQGYFIDGVTRIRIINKDTSDAEALLTMKTTRDGISRHEFEYNVPIEDAIQMIELFCSNIIEKTRYLIKEEGKKWEVDVFAGDNDGLILAEIELESKDEEIVLPYFVEKEVTNDDKYYNKQLSKKPYKSWKRLHTSYFNSTEWDYDNAISIAGKAPAWYIGKEYKLLAPKYWFFEKYKKDGDEEFYKKQYYEEVLKDLNPSAIYDDLGQGSVLLCWEKPGEFCHRHLVAEWLQMSLGIDVKEVGEESE